MRELAATVSALRWTRILPASVAVSVLTFVFIYQAVYVFVSSLSVFLRLQVSREQLDPLLLPLVGGWGARVFFLLMTIWLASWTARKAGELFVAHGMAVGLLAAVGVQTITHLRFPPVLPGEALAYLAFGAAGGYLGGRRGRAALAGQEALYRASVGIGAAQGPTAIAAAVGENLYDPTPHDVTLWRMVHGNGADGGAFEILASWTRARGDAWPAGDRLDTSRLPTLSRVAGRPFAVIRAGELPDEERGKWEIRGIRSALLVPLDASGGVRIGLLAATFRGRRLSRAAARAYLTAGAQAALALENLRLVEEARRAGRQKGVLLERQRLAHEIHDTLAQGFSSIVMNLTAAEMARPPGVADAEETKRLEDARRTARESLVEARRLVWALRPEALDRHTLPEALERLAEGWSEETGVEAGAVVAGTPRPLRPEVEVALLRAAQEALANVRKHARAGKVNVTLSFVGDLAILDVLDDGVGFDAAAPTPGVGAEDTGGFGLVAMRERVEQLGGTLLVESTPGEGTTLVVELPAAAKEPDAGGIESLEEAR